MDARMVIRTYFQLSKSESNIQHVLLMAMHYIALLPRGSQHYIYSP